MNSHKSEINAEEKRGEYITYGIDEKFMNMQYLAEKRRESYVYTINRDAQNIKQYTKVTSIGLCPGHHETQNSTYPEAGYPDRLGHSGKSVDNSTKLTCLEITGYRIKYCTVLWLLELQIRCGRKVQTQAHTVL